MKVRWAMFAVIVVSCGCAIGFRTHAQPATASESLDWQLPDERLMQPFPARQPIRFVTATQNPEQWNKLNGFWNIANETAIDPSTGATVERKAIVIKVPLGLTQPPPVPAENPMTLAKWALGKQLYFDPILSSDGKVACATCHEPGKGFTDQLPVSTGIFGKKGGMSAPTVVNSAYNQFQFWDGRAASLEDQAQGPVQNPVEMFNGEGTAWHAAVHRLRLAERYRGRFEEVFGHPATRDAVAKAIAAYERTVLSGNSVHDRAEAAMRDRVEAEESNKRDITAKDYEKVLSDLYAKGDTFTLQTLKLDAARRPGQVAQVAERLANGRTIFFGKARCNSCHVGENFTDNQFHNIGVGFAGGKTPADVLGRFAALPNGAKSSEAVGAFKTPTLRGILSTAPYMHDGSEATLEAVVDYYDRGGNANEFLDIKMRDYDAELAIVNGKAEQPAAARFGAGRKPIVPLRLNLTPSEKADLVLFLRSLQGDPVDPMVAEPGQK